MNLTNIWWFVLLLCAMGNAQGPPITADKPIMLGGKSFTTKTLAEIRTTERGTVTYLPLMLHYLPTSNSLVAIHIPYVNYDLEDTSGSSLADIKLQGKYQFYRKDGTGKTFRMVAKTIQTLPTGDEIDVMDISTGKYAGYYGVVSGLEDTQIRYFQRGGLQLDARWHAGRDASKTGFWTAAAQTTVP